MAAVIIGLGLLGSAFAGELPKKVGKDLRKRCDDADMAACVELTDALLGEGVAKLGQGPAVALPYAKAACDLGSARGCYQRGLTLEQTATRRRQLDGRKILRYYADSCDADVAEACPDLHRFLRAWEADLALPPDEIAFHVASACEKGVQAACDEAPVPEPMGRLSKAGITGILRGANVRVQACYAETRRTAPNVQGTVEAAFTIDAEGRVSALALTSDDVRHKTLLGCIEGVVQEVRFPKPAKGTVDVAFPFRLTP